MQKHKIPSPRKAREDSGLTWRALAAKAQVSQSTIKRCEDAGEYPRHPAIRASYLAALGLAESK
jgi:predicted transcriptional regulator